MRGTITSAWVLAVILLGACSTSQPVHNLPANRVNVAQCEDQVGDAIIKAGLSRGWLMRKERPGLIRGQLNLRQHQAVIDIPYGSRDHAINYVSSINLADNGEGSIDRNYNRWAQGLNQAIQIELARPHHKLPETGSRQ